MAADATIPLRRAVLTLLKATAGFTALVPAARVYPPARPSQPVWPFAAYDNVAQEPLRASCMDGALVGFRVSGFAKGDGEAATAIAGAAMVALDGATLTLDDGSKAHIRHLRTNTIPDGAESTSWIGIADFEAAVAREG